MADVSESTPYTGFLVPYRLTVADDILASVSTYTEDDPQVGDISSESAPKLALQGSGSQSLSYTLTTRQGGNVGPNGAGFTWRLSTEAAGSDRGWDSFNVWGGHRFVDHTSGALVGALTPHAVALPNGGVLVVAAGATTTTYHVYGYSIATDGTITKVAIYDAPAAPSSRIGSFHPTATVLPDGSVLCAHLVEDTTAEQAQVRVCRSTDSGATWTEVSPLALDTPIDIAASTSGDGFIITRMRMASNREQVSLIVAQDCSNTGLAVSRGGYHQFGSDSDGLQFDTVEIGSDNGITGAVAIGAVWSRPDLCVLDDEFHLVYISNAEGISHKRLSSAYTTISSLSADEVEATGGSFDMAIISSDRVSDGDLAMCADPDGSLYATFRDVGAGGDKMIILRSTDKGETWARLGQGAASPIYTWWPETGGLYPENITLCAQAGGAWLYSTFQAPTTTTYESSLCEFRIGGWSSVTFPGNTSFGRITGRAAWTDAYFAGELPGNLNWTTTTAGTTTASVALGYYSEVATVGTIYHNITPSGTVDEGALVEVVARQVSGGSVSAMRAGVSISLEGVSNGYNSQIRLLNSGAGTEQIALYDGVAGTIIGSAADVDWDEYYQIRVEQRGASVQAWYRIWTAWGDRAWTELAQTDSLTDSGGGGTSHIRWGASLASGTGTTRWRQVAYTSDEYTGVRTLPLTNPDDLFPRPYVGVGRRAVVDLNFGVTALSGPGRAGDVYTAAPEYTYPLDAAHWAVSRDLRQRWRTEVGSSGADAVTLTYAFAEVTGEDTGMPAVIGLFIAGNRGTRTGTLGVLRTAGANRQSFDLSVGGASFSATRRGNVLVPSNAATTGVFIRRNEARGWWVDLGSGVFRQVVRNTAGVLAGGADVPVRLTLAGVTGSDATSPTTCYLIPDQACVLLHLEDDDAEQIEVVLSSQQTPDDRHWAGALWLGEVVIPGIPWENGERITTVGGAEATDTPGRTAYAQDLAPAQREGEIAYTAIAHTGAIEGALVNPDYFTVNQDAAALPAGVPAAALSTVEGMYRRVNGGGRPVVLLRRMARIPDTSTKVEVLLGREAIIPCHLTGTFSVRRVVGDDGQASLVQRGEAIAWRELVPAVPEAEVVS